MDDGHAAYDFRPHKPPYRVQISPRGHPTASNSGPRDAKPVSLAPKCSNFPATGPNPTRD